MNKGKKKVITKNLLKLRRKSSNLKSNKKPTANKGVSFVKLEPNFTSSQELHGNISVVRKDSKYVNTFVKHTRFQVV